MRKWVINWWLRDQERTVSRQILKIKIKSFLFKIVKVYCNIFLLFVINKILSLIDEDEDIEDVPPGLAKEVPLVSKKVDFVKNGMS